MLFGLNEQVNTCKLLILLTGTLYKYSINVGHYSTAPVAAATITTTRRHFKSDK